MIHYEIVYLMHVGIIFISIPQFLRYVITNFILLYIGHLGVSFGIFRSSVHHNSWHLRFVEGLRCLGHDRRLTAISVRHA